MNVSVDDLHGQEVPVFAGVVHQEAVGLEGAELEVDGDLVVSLELAETDESVLATEGDGLK